MDPIVSDAIERYLASLNPVHDPLIDEVAHQGKALGLPAVDAEEGRLLEVLAKAVGARRVLEIGTAIGYSALWLARALPPDGLLITIEIDGDRAAAARGYFARAGLQERVTVMVGDAALLVHKLAGPFDLIFNDGDKRQYERLLDCLIALLRPGGLLVTDNALWGGEVVPGLVARPTRPREDTEAIASFNRRLAAESRLLTATIPLRDGIAVSVRLG